MSSREATRLMSISRVGIGLALIANPRLVTGMWLGRPSFHPAAKVLARALGIRDLAIGLGVLAAAGSGRSPRPWLVAGALADAFDVVATIIEADSLPDTAVPVVVATGGAGAAIGLYALLGDDDGGARSAPVPA
jgi:hypothetical protein